MGESSGDHALNPACVCHDTYTGDIKGVRVRIVVALDEPDLIVTIHERRR
jgi:hypothetical protein